MSRVPAQLAIPLPTAAQPRFNRGSTAVPTERQPEGQPNVNREVNRKATLHLHLTTEAYSAEEANRNNLSSSSERGLVLREDQASLVQDIQGSLKAGVRSLVAQAPTGAGKTVISATISRMAWEKGNPVLVLAPRRELVTQMAATLQSAGLPAEDIGILMAGHQPNPLAPVQVASVDTLNSRAIQRNLLDLPPARLVIMDEAHLSTSAVPRSILTHYHQLGARIIGFTATPASANATALGDIYQELIEGPSLAQLIAAGHLVPPRYFAPVTVDTSRAQMRAGEFTPKSLTQLADDTALQGDVVENWLKLARARRTIVFAIDVAHARALADQFREAGISVGVVTGADDKPEREAVLKALRDGDIQVLVNVFVLSYGFDCPPVDCIVLARPTRSVTLYLQMVGRGLRIFPGKIDCLILDHGGTVAELGFAEEDRVWTLGKPGKDGAPGRDVVQRPKENRPVDCKTCHHQFSSEHRVCPRCGTEPPKATRAYEMTPEELAEIHSRDAAKRANKDSPREVKVAFLSQLMGHAAQKGLNSGWAAHKYREKFGCWPNAYQQEAHPVAPTPEVISWIRSRQIAWAKSKHRHHNPGGRP